MTNREYYDYFHSLRIYTDEMIYDAVGNHVLSTEDYEAIMHKPYVKAKEFNNQRQ